MTWLVFFRAIEDESVSWKPVEVEADSILTAACMAHLRCELDGAYRVVQIRQKGVRA